MPPRMPASGGKAKKGTIKRLIKMVWKDHKLGVFLCLFFVVTMSASTICSPVFVGFITNCIDKYLALPHTPENAIAFWKEMTLYLSIMGGIYIEGIISAVVCNVAMAVVTQDFLNETRQAMFKHMETLPIRYFDTHKRGDIMSVYTNDIDTTRQIVRESLPGVFQTGVIVTSLIFVMLYYSLYLTIIVLFTTLVIFFTAKRIGAKSGKYFRRQQEKLGIVEGHIEEAINGLKVIKVFSHEDKSEDDFSKLNRALADDGVIANTAGNMLAPVIGNIGNLLYVVLAVVGAVFIIYSDNIHNISFSNQPVGVDTIVSFLMMARMFTNNVNNLSQQLSMIFLGSAGASRVFDLMDEVSEKDDGYVTLVNVKYRDDHTFYETSEPTRFFAWKHPHGNGTLTYTPLEGDIFLSDVDFAYNPPNLVLKRISLFARPGEKIAFVGATGAGKTTITNLINRFYDIEDGKIRYDGININKIKKSSLRKSLGIVLQDTNLFTGTVRENIRYGRLDATDQEVEEAARIANAYDFITRLPQGFDTMLSGDGSNLSQGQRQLLNIARAAIANVPVLILDEATSSIDTRTELLVQKGMDKIMEGRTTFVIAHRLSTVQNAQAIMVLDHGKIIERGTHNQLIDQKGVYYQLYTGAFELE
ncbi:MAG: ABC transporter ATP-binding protein/permease [Bacilli bacterium]|nr:ABC transporter ATP-binding protein/permease [Bacilli bacterium]